MQQLVGMYAMGTNNSQKCGIFKTSRFNIIYKTRFQKDVGNSIGKCRLTSWLLTAMAAGDFISTKANIIFKLYSFSNRKKKLFMDHLEFLRPKSITNPESVTVKADENEIVPLMLTINTLNLITYNTTAVINYYTVVN